MYNKVNHATSAFCQTPAHFMRNTKLVNQHSHVQTVVDIKLHQTARVKLC